MKRALLVAVSMMVMAGCTEQQKAAQPATAAKEVKLTGNETMIVNAVNKALTETNAKITELNRRMAVVESMDQHLTIYTERMDVVEDPNQNKTEPNGMNHENPRIPSWDGMNNVLGR